MILLVVDTQKGCFNENLYAFETVKNNIKKLIAVARENNVEVAYVQHDDGPGTSFLSRHIQTQPMTILILIKKRHTNILMNSCGEDVTQR